MNNSSMNHLTGQEIAIISMAGRFPGAKNVEEFWSNLRAGVESISTFTDEELLAAGASPADVHDPNYVPAKGVLDDIELFDGSFFGFNPREAEITDPQHRLFLECAWEALERAGYDTLRYDGRIGVYGGAGISSYLFTNLATNPEVIERVGVYQTLMRNKSDHLTGHVSYKLNLKGPSVNIQTACSTSLVAVHIACQSLLSGECDMALAGGITISVPQTSGYQYREGGINSPDGHCRPFDAQAKGTLGGNGVGLVLLKRLDEALADGDIIHAIIKGSAINNDGSRKVGYTAPSVEGQAKAIIAAQLTGELSAESISYVEAHGTATALGDPIEVAALTKAFHVSTSRSHYCALGSVKSNVGHLDAAAGVAGLIKTVLALKHRELPPSLHYTAPNPEIDFASSPFYVNNELRAWENGDGPRRAGVSSFGIGGTNAHVVVEEAPCFATAPSLRGWHLLVLSGRTASAVNAATEKLRRHLEAHPDVSLADVAYTLQVGRREFARRRAIVCRDVADAIEALREPVRWVDGAVELSAGSNGAGGGGRGAVLMYSGQGAQYAGMGRELYEREAVFRETVDQCAAAFEAAQGYDLREVLYPSVGHEEEAEARLMETEVTQPALFVLEYALTRLWQQWGLRIEALMGHSIGEYVAACVAGLMSVEDGVRLVGRRGRLMQSMERGAMLAVRLSEAEIAPWLRDERVSVAAVNGPQQCVLSGNESAITALEQQLVEAGVGVKRLATSHAFHSVMMREAAQALSQEMEGVARGNITIPYISNVSGRWAQVEEVRPGEYWGRQMLERVQWWRGVESVLESGASVLLEVGPGESLTSVVREGVRGRDVVVLSTLNRHRRGRGEEAEREMVSRLGEMWVRGVGVKWGGMYAGEERRRVELPTYEFERERYWVEPRAGAGRTSRTDEGDREGSAERKETDIGRWFYVPVWKQSVSRSAQSEGEGAEGQKWLVLREESGLSDELIARLRATGANVVSVSAGEEFTRVADDTFVVHPARRKEFERLVRELTEEGWRPERIVHLWNVGQGSSQITVDESDVRKQVDQFQAAQEHGFYSLLYLAHAWAAQPSSEPIFLTVITCDTQRVTGVETLRPERATVLGPCRVIGQEYPHIVCRSIDIQQPSQIAPRVLVKQLAAELQSKSPSFAVAYRGYDRWVQTYERVQLDQRDETQLPTRLRDGGVYLITGGLGKVGLTLAAQLVRGTRAKLILTGRTAFPARAHWQQWLDSHDEQDRVSLTIKKLQELEAEGAEILVVQADASDFERMQAVIAEAEATFGTLNGVIHAAGNVGQQAFRAISETGAEEASRQFVPKAHGLIVLEQLLAGRELDFCMLVSSLSAVLGGLGFAAYAAANVYMDTFVQKHNERDERGWLSVNWDGWRFEETRSEEEEAPLGVTAEEGSEAFMRLLDLERPTQIIVSTGDLNARLRKWIRREPLQTAPRGTDETRLTLYPRPSLSVAYLAPRNTLEQQVVAIWEELLGIAPVGVEDDFFELGGHSLLATQVVSRLRESLQLEIPLRDLFERATVAKLAASIETAQSDRYALDVPPIVRVSRDEKLPLSFAQQRLWFLDQLDPNSTLYNIPVAVRMTGELDVGALTRTMSEVVRRHEVLRTSFSNQDGQPVQVIRPAEPMSLEVIDLTDLDAEEREAAAMQWATRLHGQPFDLAHGPLLRMKLLKLGESEHVVVLVLHHVVSDVWSRGVLIREVATLYEAFRRGEPSPLPELEIQYADFAHWQRHWLQGEELERQLAYWKEQLAGAPTAMDLLPDKPRPPVQTHRGAALHFFIGEELTEGLKKVSNQHDATLFMTLVAALNVLLYRHSGQEDILTGTTIAHRNRAETEPLIGFFINTLVLRTDLSGRPSFAQLLERVRETALEAYAHQDLPFEKLVEELQPTRDMSRSPLFQVGFTLQNTPRSSLELSGLTLSAFGIEISSSKHDLTLDIAERDDGLGGLIEYNTDLFNAKTIARMIEHLQIILQSVVADAEQKITTLPLLSDVEQHQLLFEWNDTAVRYTRERVLHQLFEEQAELMGEAVAVVFEGEQLTYAELDQRANQLAHYLRANGVSNDHIVGVLMERSLELVVALLAILKAGAAYLPLDPSYPEERLRYMIDDSGLRFIVSHQAVEAMLPVLLSDSSSINVLLLDAEWATVAMQPTTSTGVRVEPDNLAYVLYTSGSTGQPKGVMISQRAICNHMLWMHERFPMKSSDAVLQKTPFSFDASVWEFYAPLIAGARLVMAQPGGHQDAAYLLDVMEREGITRLQGVPTLLRMLVNEEGLARCTQLHEVFSGGEVLRRELAESILQAHSELKLYNLYGPTEATIDTTWQEAARDRVYAGEEVGIGQPIANVQLYVLDQEMQMVPAGVVGELYIGGDGLARGYLNRPTLTAERFVPHPYSKEAGARLYRTGDMVRWLDGGELAYIGRVDAQVKVRGFRVELGEIESVLREHPSVKECIVLVKDDKAGQSLVGYIIANTLEERQASGAELRDYLRERLPEYMVPAIFMIMNEWPLTPSGKVDLKALPQPEVKRDKLTRGYVAPETPVQQIVAGIWADLLKVEVVGALDNFFELGGHSLLATQVISRMRETFKQEISLRSLFGKPTVAEWAATIELAQREGRGLEAPPIVSVSRDGKLPLSFAQQRLWFLDQLEPGSTFYNIPTAINLSGVLNVDAMERALTEIIRRHEVLRTTFSQVEGEPQQIIAPAEPFRLPIIDLRDLPAEERESEMMRLIREEAVRPFDLMRGPLLRVTFLRTGMEEHTALLTMHHIVSDGWSLGILIREVAALYTAYRAGRPTPLEELPIQYADFAHWQRQWLQGDALEQLLGYWRRQLAGAPTVLELPAAKPRPAVQTFRAAKQKVELNREVTDGLKALGRQTGVTLFMSLLAAFDVLLYRYGGQKDLLIGTPIANRNRLETEALIGFFINTLVLRIDLSGDPTFIEVLQRVREVSLEAYAHQEMPFEKLVEELQPDRSQAHSPFFQVMFVLQNIEVDNLELPGLSLSIHQEENRTAKFDLLLTMWETDRGMGGFLKYNTDIFDDSTIAKMVEHFQTLIENLLANPQQHLSDSSFLTEDETMGLTSADFPESGLSQKDFESLILQLNSSSKSAP